MTDALDGGLFGLPAAQDQVEQPDLFGQRDPAARFACPKARRAAWEAWVAGGRDLDAMPAGLLSAIAGAALGSGRKR